mgnify:CR=1 FL=1|jgi:hypothetical protein
MNGVKVIFIRHFIAFLLVIGGISLGNAAGMFQPFHYPADRSLHTFQHQKSGCIYAVGECNADLLVKIVLAGVQDANSKHVAGSGRPMNSSKNTVGVSTDDGLDDLEKGMLYLLSDVETAAIYFVSLAKRGDVDGQFALAVMYYIGTGTVLTDKVQAKKWFSKSAGKGHLFAQLAIGYMYRNGIGGLVNDFYADQYYSVACPILKVNLTKFSKIKIGSEIVREECDL